MNWTALTPVQVAALWTAAAALEQALSDDEPRGAPCNPGAAAAGTTATTLTFPGDRDLEIVQYALGVSLGYVTSTGWSIRTALGVFHTIEAEPLDPKDPRWRDRDLV